jgi:outer membrane protein, multidrug efflux system
MTKFIPRRNLTFRNSLAASLAALLLILPLGVSAQEISTHHRELPRHPLALQDCIAIALGQSPKLEASRFDLLAAGEEIRAARASLWPSLTGSATGEAFSGQNTGPFAIISTSTTGEGVNARTRVNLAGIGIFGLRLDYPIFKDGSIFGLNDAPAVEAKRAQRNALAWTTHLTREEVVYRITEDFIATVSAQNRVQPIEHRVDLLQRSLGITKEQQQNGLLLPIDVKVVSEQLSGAQSLSKAIHEQAAAGSLALNRLLGLPPSSHIRLNSTLPEPPPPPDAAQLFHTMLALHPSLQVQRANIEKAKQDYRLERFRLYPSVALRGSAVDVSDFENDAHVLIGGITVSVPIFDFGAQRGTVSARRDTYNAEQARLGSVANDLASEVVGIYEQIYASGQSILRLQGEIGKLDRDLRVAVSQQQQGITPPLTAIDAELALLGKRDELDVIWTKRLLLYAELQKTMGGAWKWIP